MSAASAEEDADDGPLARLLELARRRRVDLTRVALAALIDECLADLAATPSLAARADGIGLGATLVEMKARLLLRGEEEAPADPDAALLRARLLRLERMRAAAEALMDRDRLDRDVFARGAPELETARRVAAADLDLLDLVRAYARLRVEAAADAPLEIRRALAMTLGEALAALGARLPADGAWAGLLDLAPTPGRAVTPRSIVAASFVAALEMARRGDVELRQDATFGALELRRRPGGPRRAEGA